MSYVYREAPEYPTDSDWRPFAGGESRNSMGRAHRVNFYGVDTIANCDRATPVSFRFHYGTAWGRDEQANFVEEAFDVDPDA